MKWGGAVVLVLLVVLWIGSGWWSSFWVSKQGTVFELANGRVGVLLVPDPRNPPAVRSRWQLARIVNSHTIAWSFGTTMPPNHVFVLPSRPYTPFEFSWIPLWPLVFALLFATVAAWIMDGRARRRGRMGLCPKCGYDRSGLAPAAVCPECGSPAVVIVFTQ